MNAQAPMKRPQLERSSVRKALEVGPKDEKGDPCFTSVEQLSEFFCQEDIFALVNKALYQEGYQDAYHRKRAQKLKELRQAEKELNLQKQPVAAQAVQTVISRTVAMGKMRKRAAEEVEAETERLMAEALAEQPKVDEETVNLLTAALHQPKRS